MKGDLELVDFSLFLLVWDKEVAFLEIKMLDYIANAIISNAEDNAE